MLCCCRAFAFKHETMPYSLYFIRVRFLQCSGILELSFSAALFYYYLRLQHSLAHVQPAIFLLVKVQATMGTDTPTNPFSSITLVPCAHHTLRFMFLTDRKGPLQF